MDASYPSLSANELLEHAAWIRSLAGRLVSDEFAADDLAQDTLVAALEHPPRRSGPVRPWLARVLRNRLIVGTRRKHNRRAREAQCAQTEELPSAAELAARGEAQQHLVEAVLKLPESQRSLVLLRYYEGMTPTEIAKRMGCPASAVRGQLFRAHAELRRRLHNRMDGGDLDWRVALLPFSWTTDAVGKTAGSQLSLSGPALLIAMPTYAKLVASAALIGALSWFAQSTGPAATPDVEVPVAAAPQLMSHTRNTLKAQQPDAIDALSSERSPLRGEARVQSLPGATPMATGAIRGVVQIGDPGVAARGFLLELHRAGRTLERVETDDSGHFESELSYPAGAISIALLDHAELDASVRSGNRTLGSSPGPDVRQVDWQPGELLEIDAGLRLELRLTFFGPGGVARKLTEVHLLSRVSVAIEAFRLSAPLRWDERGAWVRFVFPDWLSIGNLDPAILHVSSMDGLWSAETQGPTEFGVHPLPFELVLDARARAELTVHWSGSEPEGLRATLKAIPMTRDTQQSTEGATVFKSEAIASGTYSVFAWADATEGVRASVTLNDGEVTRTAISLSDPEDKAILVLSLRSETGTYHGVVQFGAHSEGQRTFLGQVATWTFEDGEWIGRQEIPVPSGEYEIRPFIARGSIPWDRTMRSVHAPGPELELLYLDGGQMLALSLHVVDARTGAPVPDARGQLFPGGESVLFNHPQRSPDGYGFMWPEVHHPELATWNVEAPGYRSQKGDWLTAPTTGSARSVEVRLEPDA